MSIEFKFHNHFQTYLNFISAEEYVNMVKLMQRECKENANDASEIFLIELITI